MPSAPARRSLVGRADLLQLLHHGASRASPLAAALGYDSRPPDPVRPRRSPGQAGPSQTILADGLVPTATQNCRQPMFGAAWLPHPDAAPALADPPTATPPPPGAPLQAADWLAAPGAPLPAAPPPIVPRQRLLPVLQRLLSRPVMAGVDVPRLTQQLARCELPAELPRQARPRVATRITLVLDLAGALGYYRADLHALARWLDKHPDLRPHRICVPSEADDPLAGWDDWRVANTADPSPKRNRQQPWWWPASDEQFLLVSDLGLATATPHRRAGPAWAGWCRWLQHMARSGAQVQVCSPVPLRAPPAAAFDVARLPVLHWSAAAPLRSQPLMQGAAHHTAARRALTQALLARLACAPWIDSTVLRQVRLTLPGAADAGLEHLVWADPRLVGGSLGRRLGAPAQPQAREAFSALPTATQLQLLALLHDHYCRFSQPLQHMHALAWMSRASAQAQVDERAACDLQLALAFTRSLTQHADALQGVPKAELSLALSGWVLAADAHEQQHPLLRERFDALRAAWEHLHPQSTPLPVPAGLEPGYLAAKGASEPPRPRWLVYDARSGNVMLSPQPAQPGQGLLHSQPVIAHNIDIAWTGATRREVLRLDAVGDATQPLALPTPHRPTGRMLHLRSEAGEWHLGAIARPRGVLAWSMGLQGLALRGAPLGPLALNAGPSDIQLWPAPTGHADQALRLVVPGQASSHPGVRFGVDEVHGLWLDLHVGDATQRLRWISPGEFWMGSPDDELGRDDDEGPRHRARLNQGFWLADSPCTQQFWLALTDANPSYFKGDDRRPVEQVSWDDVQSALAKLDRALPPGVTAGLPTEAQWEYATRAGSITAFNLGQNLDDSQANLGASTCPVKEYPPNAWGLFDCHGQVDEWCADGMRTYAEVTDPVGYLLDPEGPAGPGVHRVMRGGAWSVGARGARSAYRAADPPGGRDRGLGFRFALRSTSPEGPEGPSSPGTGRLSDGPEARPPARRDAARRTKKSPR